MGDNDFTPKLFEVLPRLKALQNLVLGSFAKIPAVAWKRLAACSTIVKLVVDSAESIDDKVFLEWRALKKLVFLKLNCKSESPISNTAMRQFVEAVPLCKSQITMDLNEESAQSVIDETTKDQTLKSGGVHLDEKKGKKSDTGEGIAANFMDFIMLQYSQQQIKSDEDGLPQPRTGCVTPTPTRLDRNSPPLLVMAPAVKRVSPVPFAISASSAFHVTPAGQEISIRAFFPVKVLATVISYLAPSNIFLMQTNLHLCSGGIMQQLASVTGDANMQQLFVKVMRNMRPMAVIGKSLELSEDEVVFTDTVASTVRLLDLRKMPMGEFAARMQKIKQRYPNLDTLRLPPCTLNQELGQILASMPKVVRLDLSFCDISDPKSLQYLPRGLKALQYKQPAENCDSLWGIDCELPEINKEGMPAGWEKLLNEMAPFTDAHAACLAQFTELEVLDLAHMPKLTQVGILSLKSLKHLQILSVMYAEQLDDASFQLIEKQFPELREFHCVKNNISDLSIRYLARMRNLHTLVMGVQPKLTTAGWKGISKCYSLRRLLVTGSEQLTDDALCALADLPHLEVLNVVNVRFLSKSVVSVFSKKLPKCRILVN